MPVPELQKILKNRKKNKISDFLALSQIRKTRIMSKDTKDF